MWNNRVGRLEVVLEIIPGKWTGKEVESCEKENFILNASKIYEKISIDS